VSFFFLLVLFFLLFGTILVGHTAALFDSLGLRISTLCISSTVFVLRRCVANRREFRIIHSLVANAAKWKWFYAPSFTGLVCDLFICYFAVCRSSCIVIRAVAPNEVILTHWLVILLDTVTFGGFFFILFSHLTTVLAQLVHINLIIIIDAKGSTVSALLVLYYLESKIFQCLSFCLEAEGRCRGGGQRCGGR